MRRPRRHGPRRHLYLQIFATVVAALLAFALLSALAFRAYSDSERWARVGPTLALLVELAVGDPTLPGATLERRLARIAAVGGADLTLLDARGRVLSAVGAPIAPPPPDAFDGPADVLGHFEQRDGWGWRNRTDLWALRLGDNRVLLARPLELRAPRSGLGWFGLLLALAATVALVAYPVTRRLTRRLERLQAGVEALGAGRLSTRVPVEGRDEVAALARSFNRSAERIEALVDAHRALLANASHELRSPLARIRMAVGASDVDSAARAEVDRSISELDTLIDEILVSSRIEALAGQGDERATETVDLLALAAEEASRLPPPIEVGGEALAVRGETRLLRRLVRNLLENARRYGGSGPIDVTVGKPVGPVGPIGPVEPGGAARDAAPASPTVELRVSDRGPGVPEAERERVFEPFYRLRGASEREGGVGLGLALVRQIARRHGGSARVEPRPGGGSEFVVTLPGAQADSPRH